MNKFLLRSITAIILGTAVIAGLLWSVIAYYFIVLIIIGLAIVELQMLLEKEYGLSKRQSQLNTLLLVFMAEVFFATTALINSHAIDGKYLIIPALLPFIFFIIELVSKNDKPFKNIAYNLLSLLYISAPFAMLNYVIIENNKYQPELILGILVIIWINDIFAYLTGSVIGKTPLLKRISPAKTIEGFTGGAIAAIISGYIISTFFLQLSYKNWLTISVIIVIFGTLGDLIESMFKRSIDVKDSGKLIPGHGGILDRIDAVLFSLPFVIGYLILK